jgi:hypothetical protein
MRMRLVLFGSASRSLLAVASARRLSDRDSQLARNDSDSVSASSSRFSSALLNHANHRSDLSVPPLQRIIHIHIPRLGRMRDTKTSRPNGSNRERSMLIT